MLFEVEVGKGYKVDGGDEGGGVAGEGKEAKEWKESGDPAYPDSGLCWEGLL